MPFKIALKPTFKAKVEVYTANDRGGHDKSTFTAEFARCDMEQLDELRAMSQTEVLKKQLVGWSDLLDESDQPVDYSDATRSAILRIPEAVHGLSHAFWRSVIKAREKN